MADPKEKDERQQDAPADALQIFAGDTPAGSGLTDDQAARLALALVNESIENPEIRPAKRQQDSGADPRAQDAPVKGIAPDSSGTYHDPDQSGGLPDPAYKGTLAGSEAATDPAAVQALEAALSAGADAIAQAIREKGGIDQPDMREMITGILIESVPLLWEATNEVIALQPFMDEEMKRPDYKGKTFDDLLEAGIDKDTGELIPGSPLAKLIEAARSARDEGTPRAAAKRTDTVEYPVDKPNSIIWNLLEKDTKGQISFNMARANSNRNIPAYYAINFDELSDSVKITKRLLPFDKRVYIAVSALFNAGNKVITLTQIHYTMGNTGRPSVNQLEKINESITKMTGARIFFDNKEEAEAYKTYKRFKYDGSLLPLERCTAIVNGQVADAAIRIFREPPLISFAKKHGNQITTVKVRLLQSPVSKTDTNLQIEDYLIERISRAKNNRQKECRILYATLFDHSKLNTKKQRQRAPDKIEKYLKHYQENDFIISFVTDDSGVTITLR